VAPNQRGYAAPARPEVSAYRVKHLVADLVALIESLGAPLPLLVAHDWGGALAWNLAAQRPDLLRRLLIVNAPHPATFLRELRHNPRQQQASAYMNRARPAGRRRAAGRGRLPALWPFFTAMGGVAWLDEPMRDRYRALWRHGPGRAG
jgi:epoxide hydrolase 4